jgi:hypothetical protein
MPTQAPFLIEESQLKAVMENEMEFSLRPENRIVVQHEKDPHPIPPILSDELLAAA